MTGDGPAAAWRRIEVAFDGALRVPAPHRAAWLATHCADPGERAEVEALLAALRDSDGFLDRPVFASAADDTGLLRAGVPSTLGDWELHGAIAAGGMGEVHSARHRISGRPCAIKLPGLAATGDATAAARLRREAAALRRLDHPHVARLLDAGTMLDGAPWFAMELVDGEPLDRWVARAGPSRDERLLVFEQVCAAVAHAHAHGVLHRDLKPANVLVGRRAGDELHATVVDFGLAHLDDGVHTLPGSVLGTLPYMSPEQALGDARRVDERTDVYALGALLCELLTGRVPIDVLGLPLPAALRVVAERPPLRPGDLDPTLRGPLDVVVQHALAKDPDDRYATVHAFAADVAHCRAGAPIAARPPGRWRRLRAFTRAHRTAVALAAVAGGCLLVTAITTGIAWWNAAAAEATARAERDTALRVEHLLTETLAAADPASGNDAGALAAVLARAEALLVDLERGDAAVAARLHAVLGTIVGGHSRYEDAQAHFERAIELTTASGGDVAPRLWLELADVHFQLAAFADAAALQQCAIAALERGRDGDQAELASARARLAGTRRAQGSLDDAEALYREALATTGGSPGWRASTRSNFAGLLAARGRLDEARELHELAIRGFGEALGADHTMTLLARGNLAALLARSGELAAARAEFAAAIAGLAPRLGPAHSELATLHHGLGATLLALGEAASAAEHLRIALAARRTALPPEHPHLVSTLALLATAAHRSGDVATAIACAREALELDTAHRGDDAELLARRARTLAELRAAADDALAPAEAAGDAQPR